MGKHSIREFDPEIVARLDAQMWRAYYSHNFVKLTLLIVKMIHTQFGLNWLQSIRGACYSGRAAVDFRRNSPTQNYDRVIQDLYTYYSHIEKHAAETFDPILSADRELNWWLVHRYPKRYKQSLAKALAEAMATVYNVPPEKLKKFAEYSAKAMHIRDAATWQTKTEPDWDRIESLLQKSFTSLKETVATKNP